MTSQDDATSDFRPEYILDCYDGMDLDVCKYSQYLLRCNDEDNEDCDGDNNNRGERLPPKKRIRQFKRRPRSKILSDGTLNQYRPIDSIFYQTYIDSPDLESIDFQREFRNRFRMPYDSFLKLAKSLKESTLFKQWTRSDCTGDPCSPLELLLLGALRVLGRDDPNDSLSELTNVSRETHRSFFRKFVYYGSTTMYET